jgi:hypothetical protein
VRIGVLPRRLEGVGEAGVFGPLQHREQVAHVAGARIAEPAEHGVGVAPGEHRQGVAHDGAVLLALQVPEEVAEIADHRGVEREEEVAEPLDGAPAVEHRLHRAQGLPPVQGLQQERDLGSLRLAQAPPRLRRPRRGPELQGARPRAPLDAQLEQLRSQGRHSAPPGLAVDGEEREEHIERVVHGIARGLRLDLLGEDLHLPARDAELGKALRHLAAKAGSRPRRLGLLDLPHPVRGPAHGPVVLGIEDLGQLRGLDDLLGGDDGDRGEVLLPQAGDDVLVAPSRLVLATDDLQEGGEVLAGEAPREGQLPDPVGVQLEGQVLGAVRVLIDGLPLAEELEALNEQREALVEGELGTELLVELMDEALGDRVLRAVGARGAEGLVEEDEKASHRVEIPECRRFGRRTRGGGGCPPGPRHSPPPPAPRSSRTLSVSCGAVKGFWMKWVPGSSAPCRTMMSSV